MKKSFLAATAGILAGATLLFCAAPASAHDRVGFAISLGVPVAFAAPAPVVYGGYGPAVRVDAPYYYRDWGYYHGYRGGDHDGWRGGDHDGYRHDGYRGGERGGYHGERR